MNSEIDSELKLINDFDLLLERVLLEARRVVNADAGSIYLMETIEENGRQQQRLAIRYSQNDTLQKNLPPGEKLIYSVFHVPLDEKTASGYCGLTKKIVNVPDAYNLAPGLPYSFGISFDKATGYKTTSMLTFPLVTSEDWLLGVIQVINARDNEGNIIPFSGEMEDLISHFAVTATMALERSSLTRSMILRMIRMAELRDPKETGTHVNRVAGYAVEIYDRYAFHHGINEKEREKNRDIIRITSMLHDVGKVAISDLILKKPSRFTPEEFEIMQQHSVFGASLFKNTHSSIDIICRDIALCHHENWDGSGYPGWIDIDSLKAIKEGPDGKPKGRTGEEIPLAARIVAVADVFDALCSKRVYKEPWSEDQVLEEIHSMKGKKFDPELTDIFFEILPHIRQIQNLYPEPAE